MRGRRTQIGPAMVAAGYGWRAIAAAEVGSTAAQMYAMPYIWNKIKGKPTHYEQRESLHNANDSYYRRRRQKISVPYEMKRGYQSAYQPIKKSKYSGAPPRRGAFRSRYAASGFHNDNMSKFFVVKKERLIGLTGATSGTPGIANTAVSICDLSTCEQLNFVKNLYLKYKLKWIKVEFHGSDKLDVIYSACSFDSNDAPVDSDAVLKHFNCRVHDCDQTKYSPSRTMKLDKSQQFVDWLNTNDIDIQMGTATQTNQYNYTPSNGTLRSAIHLHLAGTPGATVRATISFGLACKTVDENAT